MNNITLESQLSHIASNSLHGNIVDQSFGPFFTDDDHHNSNNNNDNNSMCYFDNPTPNTSVVSTNASTLSTSFDTKELQIVCFHSPTKQYGHSTRTNTASLRLSPSQQQQQQCEEICLDNDYYPLDAIPNIKSELQFHLRNGSWDNLYQNLQRLEDLAPYHILTALGGHVNNNNINNHQNNGTLEVEDDIPQPPNVTTTTISLNKTTPLHTASWKAPPTIANQFLTLLKSTECDYENESRQQQESCMRENILMAVDEDGNTPLHLCAANRCMDDHNNANNNGKGGVLLQARRTTDICSAVTSKFRPKRIGRSRSTSSIAFVGDSRNYCDTNSKANGTTAEKVTASASPRTGRRNKSARNYAIADKENDDPQTTKIAPTKLDNQLWQVKFGNSNWCIPETSPTSVPPQGEKKPVTIATATSSSIVKWNKPPSLGSRSKITTLDKKGGGWSSSAAAEKNLKMIKPNSSVKRSKSAGSYSILEDDNDDADDHHHTSVKEEETQKFDIDQQLWQVQFGNSNWHIPNKEETRPQISGSNHDGIATTRIGGGDAVHALPDDNDDRTTNNNANDDNEQTFDNQLWQVEFGNSNWHISNNLMTSQTASNGIGHGDGGGPSTNAITAFAKSPVNVTEKSKDNDDSLNTNVSIVPYNCSNDANRTNSKPLKKDIDFLQSLVEAAPQALILQNNEGDTPIHLAVCSPTSSPSAVSALIDTYARYYNTHNHVNNEVKDDLNTSMVSAISMEDLLLMQDETGATPLHSAIANNATTQVILKLIQTEPMAARVADHRGMLPLHYVAAFCHTPIHVVKKLIHMYPDSIKVKTIDGDTPLHLAIANSTSSKTECNISPSKAHENMLQMKQTINLLTNSQQPQSHQQLIANNRTTNKGGNTNITTTTNSFNSPILMTNMEKLNPLHCCAQFDAPHQLTKSLMYHPDALEASTMTNMFGFTPFHIALSKPSISQSSNNNTIRSVMSLGTAEAAIIKDRSTRRTPLHVASSNPNITQQIIEEVIKLKPDVTHYQTSKGELPLHLALQFNSNNVPVIKTLIRAYSRGCESKNKWNDTPLHYAVKFGSGLDVVKMLVDTYPGAIGVVNEDGNLPLHCATICRSGEHVVEFLLKSWPDGASIQNKNKDTAIYYAAAYITSPSILESLINAAPEMTCRSNQDGRTPLDNAKESDAPENVIEILQRNDSKQKSREETSGGSNSSGSGKMLVENDSTSSGSVVNGGWVSFGADDFNNVKKNKKTVRSCTF